MRFCIHNVAHNVGGRYRAEWVPETLYQQRLDQGKCTYSSGCHRPPADGTSLCEHHHRKHKRSKREAAQRKRDERRAAGLCLYCPGDKPAKVAPPKTTCAACKIRRGQVNGMGVDGIGEASDIARQERIAAATRKGDDGRTRFHGQQKRGSQPRIQVDDQDFRYARQSLEAGQAGLHLFERAVAAREPRFQRDDIKSAALHQINRAMGFLEEILDRRGYFGDGSGGHFRMRHGRRDGE